MIAVTADLPAAAHVRRGEAITAALLFAPCVAFLVALFILPVIYVLALSVTDPAPSLQHFVRIFTVPIYLKILWNTFFTSLLVTLACLALGYPLAYVIARRNDALALVLLGIVAMSFWTSFLVRTYAWLVILGNRGPVVAFYEAVGLGTPPQLLFTSFSSALGMTHILLPYMVLALYSVMSKVDPNHLRAAASLGARPFAAFRLCVSAAEPARRRQWLILVFTICLGFYVTPILLGTPRDMMISQLINQQIEELLNWGFAAALATVLLIATVIVLSIYNRFVGLDRLWG